MNFIFLLNRVLSICHSYVIRMSSVCHSCILVCHPYVIRHWFNHEPLQILITLLLRIIYKFLDMIWIWNLHWAYISINEVGQWFNQLDHVSFSKNCNMVCKLYAALLPNLFLSNFNFITGVKVDIKSWHLDWYLVRGCTPESIPRKIMLPHSWRYL